VELRRSKAARQVPKIGNVREVGTRHWERSEEELINQSVDKDMF